MRICESPMNSKFSDDLVDLANVENNPNLATTG